MEKFIENPMTIDSLWDELDKIEIEMQIWEEEEAERADLEFEREQEWALMYGDGVFF